MKTPFDELVDEISARPVRLGWWGFAFILALVFGIPLALHLIAQARAQERPRVIFDCQQFATYARGMATLRDVGADKDRVLAELRRDVRPGMMLAVLERELRLVWAQKLPRIEVEHSAYKRCQAQLGDMGQEG